MLFTLSKCKFVFNIHLVLFRTYILKKIPHRLPPPNLRDLKLKSILQKILKRKACMWKNIKKCNVPRRVKYRVVHSHVINYNDNFEMRRYFEAGNNDLLEFIQNHYKPYLYISLQIVYVDKRYSSLYLLMKMKKIM